MNNHIPCLSCQSKTCENTDNALEQTCPRLEKWIAEKEKKTTVEELEKRIEGLEKAVGLMACWLYPQALGEEDVHAIIKELKTPPTFNEKGEEI